MHLCSRKSFVIQPHLQKKWVYFFFFMNRYDDIHRMDGIKRLSFHIMFYRLFRKYIVYGNTFSSFEWLRSLHAAHHGAWTGDRSRMRTTSQDKTRSSFLNEALQLQHGHAFISTAVLKQPIWSRWNSNNRAICVRRLFLCERSAPFLFSRLWTIT